jgi:hypothetical protein
VAALADDPLRGDFSDNGVHLLKSDTRSSQKPVPYYLAEKNAFAGKL